MTSDTFLQFTKGNEAAFKQLFLEYSPGMLAFARQFVSEEKTQDILQDIFLQVWNRRTDFHNAEAVKSYLFTSVKNQCLNTLRNEHMHSSYLESLTEADFEDQMLDVEVYTYLYKAIGELPANYRQAIKGSLCGLHLEEIAQRMNATVDAVKAYKRRGKELLRKKLKWDDLY